MSEGPILVSMRAYLHLDIKDYFLFQALVPTNAGEYFAACLASAFLAFLSVVLQSLTPAFEHRWCNLEYSTKSRRERFTVALRRGAWSTLALAISSLVMLIIMSFNVGFFLSIIAGHFVGVFVISGDPVPTDTVETRTMNVYEGL